MKIVYFISILICQLYFSQNVNYGGYIDGNVNSEYIVKLINISDTINLHIENTIEKKFLFKDINIGSYRREILIENKKYTDTITIERNILDDSIMVSERVMDELVINNYGKNRIYIENGILKINVDKSSILSSGNLLETISKLPSISFNHINNRIKLKGKEGVQIQIDGQLLYMNNDELITFLKNFSSSDVEEIEISSMPSAKYDANEIGGVINIKTKKIKKRGLLLSSSFNATQGKYYKQSIGTRLQYNNDKKYFGLSYLNSFGKDFEETNSDIYRYNSILSKQNTYAKISNNVHTILSFLENNFGKSSLKINSKITFFREKIAQNTKTNNPLLLLDILSNQDSKNILKSIDTGINYSYKTGKSNILLKTNYVYYGIDNRSHLNSVEYFRNTNEYIYIENKAPNSTKIAVFQADYTNNIDSLSNIELGLKYFHQKINNENIFFKKEQGNIIYDPTNSSEYDYKENILSGYTQYSRQFKNIDMILGARLEYTPIYGTQKQSSNTFRREYIGLFPYLNISYNKENIGVSISYNKKISRPNFSDIMPYIYHIDRYTLMKGNPQLYAGISNQIELQYVYKQKYILGINYSSTKNGIYQAYLKEGNNPLTIITPINVDRINTMSLNSSLSFDFTNKWSFSISGFIFLDRIYSRGSNLDIDDKKWSTQFSVSNYWKLPLGINMESILDYQSSFIQGPYKTAPFYTLNIGVNKDFLEKKLRISIVGNDILKTSKIYNNSIIHNQNIKIEQKLDNRWIKLSIIYKINDGKNKRIDISDENIDNIKSRIK